MAALEGRVTSHVYIIERDERHSLLHAACVHRYEMLAVRGACKAAHRSSFPA
jgi:hypothetical protein